MHSASFFPSSVSKDDNSELMKPVTMQDIKHILSISKNDKSLGPNGIPVEVYRCLFDVLGEDLLRVIEISWLSGKILAVFKSNFLALIPKIDHPLSFEDFRTISLRNFFYKIMGNLGVYLVNSLGFCRVGRFMMLKGCNDKD